MVCLRCVAVGLICLGTASAALITSSTQIGGSQTVVDFSQFAGANTITTMGPTSLGHGVTFQSTNPDGSVLGSGPYSLNDNGTWDSAINFAGLDIDQFGGDQYTMTFSFSQPVSAVGGFLNYAFYPFSGYSDVMMAALDSHGSVLESYDISTMAPISTPGGVDAGQFLGISRSSADIASFALSNSAVAIADLTFSSTSSAVPEPGACYLLGAGMVFLAWRLRRQ